MTPGTTVADAPPLHARSPKRRALAAGASALVLLATGVLACGRGATTGPDRCAGKSRQAGTREVVLESGGRERRFVLTVPESALGDAPAPLVLAFHGVNSTPEAFVAVTRFPEKAAEAGFLLAAGAGVGRSWNAGVCCEPAMSLGVDDVAFARDVVAAVEEELCVDPFRVFATGFSNGAAMTFRLACQAADLFTATAAVAGGIASSCMPERATPILVVNNVDDPVVPFVLGEVAFDRFTRIHACSDERVSSEPAPNASCEAAPDCETGGSVELCAVSGTSHVWPGGAVDPGGPYRATDAVWDFFASTRS